MDGATLARILSYLHKLPRDSDDFITLREASIRSIVAIEGTRSEGQAGNEADQGSSWIDIVKNFPVPPKNALLASKSRSEVWIERVDDNGDQPSATLKELIEAERQQDCPVSPVPENLDDSPSIPVPSTPPTYSQERPTTTELQATKVEVTQVLAQSLSMSLPSSTLSDSRFGDMLTDMNFMPPSIERPTFDKRNASQPPYSFGLSSSPPMERSASGAVGHEPGTFGDFSTEHLFL